MGLLCMLAATFVFVAECAPSGAIDPGAGDTPAVRALVTRTALAALPDPLREYFTRQDEVVNGHVPKAIAPSERFLLLDVAARGTSPADVAAAVRAFPRDIKAARRLFDEHSVATGGTLPWALNGHVIALTRAFRSADEGQILQEVSAVCGLAAAAALPFNTTVHRDGMVDGNLTWTVRSRQNMHATPRSRYQTVLIDRLAERLAFEMRVHPDRVATMADPVPASFETLVGSHDRLSALLEVDRELTHDLDLHDARSFLAGADAYYNRLSERTASIIESQLESGAVLAASLITTAWHRAGRPAPPAVEIDAQRVAGGAGRFVGSRHSNKFHADTCGHAARIKPENRVLFETAAEAVAAGRTPCGTCRPGE